MNVNSDRVLWRTERLTRADNERDSSSSIFYLENNLCGLNDFIGPLPRLEMCKLRGFSRACVSTQHQSSRRTMHPSSPRRTVVTQPRVHALRWHVDMTTAIPPSLWNRGPQTAAEVNAAGPRSLHRTEVPHKTFLEGGGRSQKKAMNAIINRKSARYFLSPL